MGPKRKRTSAPVSSDVSLPFTFVNSSVNLHQGQAFDVSITSANHSVYYPLNSYGDENTPLTFLIKGTETQFIELDKIELYLSICIEDEKGQIVTNPYKFNKTDGTPDSIPVHLSPVNLMAESLFSKVRLTKCIKIILVHTC